MHSVQTITYGVILAQSGALNISGVH